MPSFEENAEAAEAALKPHLTPEFLAVLVLAAKTCGSSVDFVEVHDFLAWCHDVAGVPLAPVTPFVYEDTP